MKFLKKMISAQLHKNYDIDKIMGRTAAPVIAHIYSGGGAKGAYQAGLINFLNKEGVLQQPAIMTGASIGLMVALIYAESIYQGASWLDATKTGVNTFRSIKKRTLLDVDVSHLLEPWRMDHIFKQAPIRAFLETIVSKDRVWQDYEKKGLKVIAAASCVNEQTFTVFDSAENAITTTLAGAAIQMGFPPVIINNNIYTDAGLMCNVPLKPAIRAGATELWIFNLDRPQDLWMPTKTYTDAQGNTVKGWDKYRLSEKLGRYVSMATTAKMFEDVKKLKFINDLISFAFENLKDQEQRKIFLEKIHFQQYSGFEKRYIKYYDLIPSGWTGGILDFDKEKIEAAVQLGEKDGAAFVKEFNTKKQKE